MDIANAFLPSVQHERGVPSVGCSKIV